MYAKRILVYDGQKKIIFLFLVFGDVSYLFMSQKFVFEGTLFFMFMGINNKTIWQLGIKILELFESCKLGKKSSMFESQKRFRVYYLSPLSSLNRHLKTHCRFELEKKTRKKKSSKIDLRLS